MNLKHIKRTDRCLNCGTSLNSNFDNFCLHCGQVNNSKKETAGELLGELVGDFLHLDSKVMGSLIPLLIKPGKLTVDYNNGKRARYLHPVRMFISIMIIFVIVNGLTSSSELEDPTSKKVRSKEAVKDSSSDTENDLDDIIFFDEDSLPNFTDSIKNEIEKQKQTKGGLQITVGDGEKYDEAYKLYESGVHSLDKIFDSLHIEPTLWNKFIYSQVVKVNQFNAGGESRHAFVEYLQHKLPWIVFCMLPIFAFLLKLLYIRRKVLYVDQLIFAFHLHSFFFLAATLLLVIDMFISIDIRFFGLLYILLYTIFAMKKMYNQSWRKTAFKFFCLFFLYVLLGIVSSLLITIILFMLY
jgi:hypothetical protein